MDELYLRSLWKAQRHHQAYSARFDELNFYSQVYHRKQYDVIQRPFHMEEDAQGNYIPLRERRPSVKYPLPRIVVRKSATMAFAGRNWPQVACEDQRISDLIDEIYRRFAFQQLMTRAMTYGSIGTVVPMFRVEPESKRFYFDVWNARDCHPRFAQNGVLEEILLKYMTDTASLRSMGFEIPLDEPLNGKWWYRRKLTTEEDIVYAPTRENDWEDVGENMRPLGDPFSYIHELGFVPADWVKNLPTEDDENGTLDGFCTFNPIIDINIEIDYQLSQLGRGLKYNADPEIALKEPIEPHDGRGVNVVRSSSRKIEVSEKGDVKLLEMQGGGMKIQLEYIEKLRNFALETLRGSRKDPQRALSHAQSGKLAEMLEDDLVSLVSELRTSYTCGMLLPMTIKMVVAMKKHRMGGSEVKRITADDLLSLKYEWGPWFPPTSTDIYQVAEASDKLVKGLLVDIDTVRAMTYHTLGRVMPKNVDFEINLTAIAKAERAANLWQLENTALKAAATPDTSEMEGLGPEATPEAKQAAKERSQADAALKGMQILEDIREEIEAEDNGESGPGEGITLEDVYDVHTPIN